MKFSSRFFSWWAGFSGLALMGGACPCCSGAVCLSGIAVFGVMGAALSSLLKFQKQPEAAPDSLAAVAPSPAFIRHDFLLENSTELEVIRPS